MNEKLKKNFDKHQPNIRMIFPPEIIADLIRKSKPARRQKNDSSI